MKIEEKRDKLRKYGIYKKEYDRLFNELINHLKESQEENYIRSSKYSFAPSKSKGLNRDFTDRLTDRMEEERELLIKTRDTFRNMNKLGYEIETAAEKLSDIDSSLARVIMFRYIDCYTTWKVAEIMKINEQTVKVKQRKALQLIEI